MNSPQFNSEQLSVIASAIRTLIWASSQSDEQRLQLAIQGSRRLLQRHQLQEQLADIFDFLSTGNVTQALEGLRVFSSPEYVHINYGETDSSQLLNTTKKDSQQVDNLSESTVERTVEAPTVEVPTTEKETTEEQGLTIDNPQSEESLHPKELDTSSIENELDPSSTEQVTAEPAAVIADEKESQQDILAFRHKLRRRFPLKERGDFRPSIAPSSRRDFWHPECGGAELAEVFRVEEELLNTLEKHSIRKVADLLLHPPQEFIRSSITSINSTMSDGSVMVRGTILGKWMRLSPHIDQWELRLSGQKDAELRCIWMSKPPRGWEKWQTGDVIGLVGDIVVDEHICIFEAEPVGTNGKGSGIFPVYKLSDIDERELRDLVAQALDYVQNRIQDPLPKEIVERYRLLGLNDALRDAHFPANTSYRGRYRICFDEVFFYLAGQRMNSDKNTDSRGISHRLAHEGVARLGMIKNIQLNDAQELAFSEIRRDLISHKVMRRVIQGDVGAGKTLIAILAAIMVAQSGQQVQYLTADPFMAERRFLLASNLLRPIGLNALLVIGKPNSAHLDAISRGEASLVFVSQNVQSWGLPWKSLGFTIIEEIDSFGTLLPKRQDKAKKCDLLVLTPTPQPMGVLETVYSHLNISLLPSMSYPVSNTTYHDADCRKDVYAEAMQFLQEGRQAIIVLPLKNGKDLLSLDEALRMAGVLGQKLLKDMRIGVYCSEMQRNERLRVFDDFQRRNIDVLFCTTVIEDAPDVGNASILIVEYADKHSLMRLHRLRGHISKSHYRPICRMVFSDNVEAVERKKVELVCGESNGFLLAEIDERERGLVSITNNEELSFPSYKWVQYCMHRDLRMKARHASQGLAIRDLLQHRWPLLNSAIQHWWGELIQVQPKVPVRRRKRRRRKRSK